MALRGIYDGGGLRKQNGHYQSSNMGNREDDGSFYTGKYAETIYNEITKVYNPHYYISYPGTWFSTQPKWSNKSFAIRPGATQVLGFKLVTKKTKKGKKFIPQLLMKIGGPWKVNFGSFILSLNGSFNNNDGRTYNKSKYAWSTQKTSFVPLELDSDVFTAKYRMYPDFEQLGKYTKFFLGNGKNPTANLYLWEMENYCNSSYREKALIPKAKKYAGIRMKMKIEYRNYSNTWNESTGEREYNYEDQKHGPSSCSLDVPPVYSDYHQGYYTDGTYWNGSIEYELTNTTKSTINVTLGDFYLFTNIYANGVQPVSKFTSFYSFYTKKKSTSTKK